MDFDKIITGIRKALYGREVREYIASAIEWVKSAINDALEKMKEFLRQAEAARDAAKASADASEASAVKSANSATESANSAAASKASADASANSATASANSATESAGYANASAASANESAGYASDSANSAAASKASAEDSANAAMKALQEAADSGAFKGDKGEKGDKGDKGDPGATNWDEINGKPDLLPLSGGTMNNGARIVFADSGTWDAGNGTYPRDCGGLRWSGQSDTVYLYAEETGGDNLDLVVQFGDDNSNGFSIRNNGGTQTARITATGAMIASGGFQGNLNGDCYGYADYLYNEGVGRMRFHWSGQGGQPTWLWGSNDGSNAYVWNPSNFSVNYANNSGNGVVANGSNYVRFGDGTQICWSTAPATWSDTSGDTTYTAYVFGFPAAFANSDYSVVIAGTSNILAGGALSGHWAKTSTYVPFMVNWHSAIAIGRWR